MDKEYMALRHIYQHGVTTQRDLAKDVGVSVGGANMLVQLMVKKGFLKVERLSTKTLRYILTPKGMKEKIRLTYYYAKISYRRITLIKEEVKFIMKEQSERQGPVKEVALFGPDDEIKDIIKMTLSNIGVTSRSFDDTMDLKTFVEATNDRCPVFVWTAEEQELVEGWYGNMHNVLQRVVY